MADSALAAHAAARLSGEQAAITTFLDTRHQALSLFTSKGYNAVSMRELAAALGINCGSIYNHIESKEALLYELLEELLDALQTNALQIQRSVKAPKRLGKIIEMHLKLQDRMPLHFQLLERESRHLSEPWLSSADVHRDGYQEIIAAAIGPSASRQDLSRSVVTLLNQTPDWLPALKLSGRARLELVRAMVELMLARTVSNPLAQHTGEAS